MKIKYREVLANLQNLTGIEYSHKNIANLLADTIKHPSAGTLQSRYFSDGYLNDEEISKIEEVLAVDLTSGASNDCIEIDHIHINPSCGKGTVVLDDAEITPVKLGTQLIQSVLKISDPKNLKTFKASGDSMEPIIEDGDLLLVDTARNDFSNGGIFLITINNDWFIKRLRKRLSGELDIISDNQKYSVETFKPETNIPIEIKGRVVKNLSRGL